MPNVDSIAPNFSRREQRGTDALHSAMDGDGDRRENPSKRRRERKIIAFTGTAALLALAINFAVFAFNSHKQKHKKKGLHGSSVQINLSASEIRNLTDRIIAKSKAVHDAVASVPMEKVTYQNIKVLAELEAQLFPLVQSCIFPRLVSTLEDVRKASAEAEFRISDHVCACSKREDVYRVVKAFSSKQEGMNAEPERYVQYLIRDFERNGLNLTSAKKEELQRLKGQIDELSMQYILNLSDDHTSLVFKEADLDGLPPEFLQSLDRDGSGEYKVTLKSNHVSPVLEFCKVGMSRRRLAVAYGQRCKEVNVPLLEHLVQLRHKFARLLGYENYADYAIDFRMAKNSSKVLEFLEELSTSLSDQADKELLILKDLKKKEEGESPFGIEDLPYYVKRVEEERFDLDFGALKQYFPLNLVLHGIFKIFQDLLGMRFDEIPDAEVWHHDVNVFSVSDLSSGELLGYVYLDLYSRGGKYSQTCVVPLQNGSLSSQGTRQIPVILLLSEFHKEVGGKPGLLRFSEVVNLFHEFGHVVHHICNRASLVRFSGLRVDPDFVEIPSQLFENWCYETTILKLISGLHQDITMPIKDDICMFLKKWKYSFAALKLRQEILYCLFDQIIHSADNVDFLELFKDLHPEVMLGLPVLEGTNPASCFPQSAISYEAACYSRIWSKVFAADIFASKFRDALLNQYVGLQFRSKVLLPGGAKDPEEALTDFLGRQPSIQSFVDSITSSSL